MSEPNTKESAAKRFTVRLSTEFEVDTHLDFQEETLRDLLPTITFRRALLDTLLAKMDHLNKDNPVDKAALSAYEFDEDLIESALEKLDISVVERN